MVRSDIRDRISAPAPAVASLPPGYGSSLQQLAAAFSRLTRAAARRDVRPEPTNRGRAA
ncbi:hypothetical protein RHODGE_RHODGE_00281 [Rhodoplanes serenus]|uniref:Uncharacterized protein n=1 Tax=Rhodoplanes serenus TaxID=200615 RepID=A0A447CQ23_9BRAD|nr:hypothetical protein RHODGE_RHODGE_00281 [Rhodoplanes serenus]